MIMTSIYFLEQILKKSHEMRTYQREAEKKNDAKFFSLAKKKEKEFDALCFTIRQLLDSKQIEK